MMKELRLMKGLRMIRSDKRTDKSQGEEFGNKPQIGRQGMELTVANGSYGLSTATRALMIGVAVIIVCIVCSLALYMSKQGKTAINTGTNQYNKMLEDYQELDRAMYDGLEVSGNEVGLLIERMIAQKEYSAVRVKTKAADYVCYNYFYNAESNTITNEEGSSFKMELTVDKGDDTYINPQADFFGKVIKNANGTIICIDFVQR